MRVTAKIVKTSIVNVRFNITYPPFVDLLQSPSAEMSPEARSIWRGDYLLWVTLMASPSGERPAPGCE